MEIPFLKDLAVIFALSIAVLLVCHRLRIPTIVGFLLTGAVAGPSGLELIHAHEDVKVLAEIGVVLLLFSIGIEFSLENLLRIRKAIFLGGTVQVLLTFLVGFSVASAFGIHKGAAMFLGFLLSLSSTAIVLKGLQQRAELESPHGRTTLAVLIFQDVAVVPMMLLTPVLAGDLQTVGNSLLPLLVKGVAIVVLAIISAKWFVPWILYQVARTRSSELFTVSVVMICVAVAWLTSAAGLSVGLGAFLAGLIISESEYSSHALGGIRPFRDVFSSFFFISIGMLLDCRFLIEEPVWILLATLGVLFVKGGVAALATLILGYPVRTLVLVGVALCQIGEFSFLLAEMGLEHGLFVGKTYQLFLAVSVLTMAATPFLLALAPRLAAALTRLPLPEKLKSGKRSTAVSGRPGRTNHLVIVGFGVNGRNLARISKLVGIEYVIVEMNAETVRRERANGEPIFYGDAMHTVVLKHAGIEHARVLVVAIPDPVAVRKITETAREMNSVVHIIVRARFLDQLKPLVQCGASDVVCAEFETSVEIFTRVLRKYLIPQDEIDRFTTEIRSDSYDMLRSPSLAPLALSDLPLMHSELEITVLRVREGSRVSGKTLAELHLRRDHGVTVLGIRNVGRMSLDVSPHDKLEVDNLVLLLSRPENLVDVSALFRPEPVPDRAVEEIDDVEKTEREDVLEADH